MLLERWVIAKLVEANGPVIQSETKDPLLTRTLQSVMLKKQILHSVQDDGIGDRKEICNHLPVYSAINYV